MTVTAEPTATPAPEAGLKDGRVVAIAGPVVDVEFPPDALPEINHALEMTIELEGDDDHRHRRGGAADRRRPGARHLPEADRRPDARHARAQHRPRHHGSGGQRRARARVQRHRRAARRGQGRGHHRALGDPPRSARLRRPRAQAPDVRDGHQGHRPAGALRAGRQDRPLRRRRRRQDHGHHRDDQPGRHPARWCVGVRGRGRAHP